MFILQGTTARLERLASASPKPEHLLENGPESFATCKDSMMGSQGCALWPVRETPVFTCGFPLQAEASLMAQINEEQVSLRGEHLKSTAKGLSFLLKSLVETQESWLSVEMLIPWTLTSPQTYTLSRDSCLCLLSSGTRLANVYWVSTTSFLPPQRLAARIAPLLPVTIWSHLTWRECEKRKAQATTHKGM